MGIYACLYYFVTTMLAVFLGIALVLTIHPGNKDIKEDMGNGTQREKVSSLDTSLDLIRLEESLKNIFALHPLCILYY